MSGANTPPGYALGIDLLPSAARPGYALGLEFVRGPVPPRPDPSAVRPGGSLPAPAVAFAGVLHAIVQSSTATVRPGGSLPFAPPALAGQIGAFYAERHSLAPAIHLPAPLLGFAGSLSAPYDSRVQRPLARFARAEVFQQAQTLANAPLAAVMQDAARASAQVQSVVQQAQAMAAQVQGTAQQARSLPAQVRDAAQQARPLRQRSTSAFEVAKSLHHALQAQAQQAQRLPVVAMVYAWQIADPRRGQHLERFEQAGIQRHMGLRVPPAYVLGPGWRIALEFAPQFAVPRTWGELQTGPLLSGAGLAQRAAQAARVRYQDAMRVAPGIALDPVVPVDPTDPTDPTDPAAYTIPVLKVYMTAHTLAAVLLPSGDPVTLESVSIATDDDAYCWSLSASGPVHLLEQLAPVDGLPARVQVTIDGVDFVFAITSLSRSRSFAQQRVQLQGSSVTSLLGAPYMPPGAWRATHDITAQQLASLPLEFSGAALDWQITDWLLPAAAAELSGTPLQAVLRVAEGVGAVVRSHRTQPQLIIAPRYPVLPWHWATATPDVHMPAAVIATDELRPEPRAPYNAVHVAGGASGGILGHVRLLGSAGDLPAPQIQDDLITHIDAARMRGSWALAAAGSKLLQSITMPVLTGVNPEGGTYPGILQPGQLLQVADTDTTWRGLVRSVSVTASLPAVRQQITVERLATA